MQFQSSLRPALRRLVLALVLLAFGAPSAVTAQQAPGSIEGTARGEEENAPLAFSLIRLLPEDGPATAALGVLTDAEGRFRFPAVPAGAYRVQVEQIGYERVVSPVLRVRAGETTRHDIRGTLRPVLLEGITVAAGRCLDASRLGEDPELAALWNEAKKGVETRRAFELQYGFTRVMSQDIETRWRLRPTAHRHTEDTLVSRPDSVAVRDQRRRARFRAEGYASGNELRLPEEKELLDDEFLRDHCLEPSFEQAEGAYLLHFRPLQPGRDGAIRGTIRIDADTYLIRRLDFGYLRGGREYAQSNVDYLDTPIAGGTLRLPAGGRASLRPTGVSRALATRASSTFRFTYRDVRPVRSN